MNTFKGNLMAVALSLFIASRTGSGQTTQERPDTTNGLSNSDNGYFPIDVAVTTRILHSEDSALIVNPFNSLTAKDAMKTAVAFSTKMNTTRKANSIADFAKRHQIKWRGHTQCHYRRRQEIIQ